tara:strand:- start:9126 stop:9443 length:318 start_codon:yes stop_codon:yes gene_type:complete
MFSSVSLAGPGHGHSHGHSHGKKSNSITEDKAKSVATSEIKRLIGLKKLDSSWENATFDKAEKKKFKGKSEWVLTFDNENGVKGKKLFVFLSLAGDFVAANFTGK